MMVFTRRFFLLFTPILIGCLVVCLIITYGVSAQSVTLPPDITLTIDTTQDRKPISPLIYGSNQPLPHFDQWGARRAGGNRTTTLNWETNASNAGADFFHTSDDWLCTPAVFNVDEATCDTPGGLYTTFHEESQQLDVYSLVTLQMAGYVAADTDGAVTEDESAPSDRWIPIQFAKGAPFVYPPDTTDDIVYMDEQVAHYVDTFGTAADGGIHAYSLDNEPSAWDDSHPRIHPTDITATELLSRSISLATAIKDVDGTAEIYGPALFGFPSYRIMGGEDWDTTGEGYDWFIDYYLEKMNEAEQAEGRRLLDVLDVHWYSAAQADGNPIISFGTAGSAGEPPAVYSARTQAPRTLWDASYAEDSWIASFFPQYLPVIPRIQQSIETHYPDTKLAMTEWNAGGGDHVSGGLATADTLGIFGANDVYMATHWQINDASQQGYVQAAFQLFRDYDGAQSAYGDTHVSADSSDVEHVAVYASEDADGNLHVIVINRDAREDAAGTFNITSDTAYQSGDVWGFNESVVTVTLKTAVSSITDNQFSYVVPAMSAHHFVLSAAPLTPTPTPGLGTPSATPAPTRTPFPTATPTPVVELGEPIVGNGDFATDEMAWWTKGGVDALEIVDEELVVTVGDAGTEPWGAEVAQTYFSLDFGQTYRLAFDARADQERNLFALVGYREPEQPFTDYLNKTVQVNEEMQSFSFDFTMNENTEWASVAFQMGRENDSVFVIDNVAFQKILGSGSSFFDGLANNFVTNGTFDTADTAPWWAYGHESFESVDGEFSISIVDGGAGVWAVGLGQGHFTVSAGQTYRLAFEAKASADRDIIALIGYREPEKDAINYLREVVPLTDTMQPHIFEITIPDDTEWATVEFQLGAVNDSVVTLDNIVFGELAETTAVTVNQIDHAPPSMMLWGLLLMVLCVLSGMVVLRGR